MKRMIANLGLALLLALPARMAAAQEARPADRPGHREWAWDGGDSLAVGGAMIVTVSKDGPPRVVMNGPPELVERATLRRGRLGFDGSNGWWGDWRPREPVEVTITGVTLADVSVSGSSQVTLKDSVQQPSFEVHVSGSGSIRADGRAGRLGAHVSGSGRVLLAGMTARQGDIDVSGSGSVTLDAVEDADVSISGSGQVRIAAAPRALSRSISGAGQLSAGGETYSRADRRREEERRRRDRDR